MDFFRELFQFLKVRKKFWLLPIIIVLLVFGALIVEGQIVAAAQEERFTRKKHDSGFPSNAVRFCLEFAKIPPDQLDQVAFYDKPFLKFERLLETYLAFAPRGFTSFKEALPLWLKEKLFQKSLLAKAL